MKTTPMSMVLAWTNDEPKSSWDEEDKWEDDLIEQSIEDAAIEADIKRQDDAFRKAKNNG